MTCTTKMNMTQARRWAVLAGLMLATAVCSACGDEETGPTGPESERLSDEEPMPSGDPLQLTTSNSGVRLYWGEPTLISSASTFDVYSTKFGAAVVVAQMLDEREALTTSPQNVQSNPAPYQAKARVRSLLTEVDDVLTATGATDWSQYVLVIDLFRLSSEWLVRWDGVSINNYTGPGAYGLWRDDMRDDSKAVIVETVAEAVADGRNVTHVVVGDGMERLLMLNPLDYANFVSFYGEVREAIKASFPDVKVSAGLQWDRFVGEAALAYASDGTAETLAWSDIRGAWRDLAEPLYAQSDFIALSSEPVPSNYDSDAENIPNSHYALLAEVQGDRPIVWFSLNWPVTSSAAKSNQVKFLERFLTLNAGNTVDLVAWKAAIDLDETACRLVESVQGPPTDCNAGLFTSSVAPSALSDVFADLP